MGEAAWEIRNQTMPRRGKPGWRGQHPDKTRPHKAPCTGLGGLGGLRIPTKLRLCPNILCLSQESCRERFPTGSLK